MTSQIIDLGPCLPSTRYRNAEGYAVRATGPRGSQVRTYEHRWVWGQAHGPIPVGMVLDHVCHTLDLSCSGGPRCLHRRCIELKHLEVVTPGKNSRRSHVSVASVNARKTHCKRGHEFTPENTYYRPDRRNGTRQCKTCMGERFAAWVVPELDPDDPRHGTLNGYNTYRCRCGGCRAALAAYRRGWKARRRASG